MRINVLYFASVREAMGQDTIALTLPQNIQTIGDLKTFIGHKNPNFRKIIPLISSVNQTTANDKTPISPNDEVAFFPPVTGG